MTEMEINNHSFVELEKLKTQIESMDKIHHIEILRILKKFNDVKLNENKSGVFVNLSFLSNNVVEELAKYVDYVNMQENEILKMETQQEQCKTLFFADSENT